MVKMQNFSCTAERVFPKIVVGLISPTVGRPSVMNMMRETLFGPASGLERYSRSRSEPVWMPPSIFVPAVSEEMSEQILFKDWKYSQ